MPTFRPTNAGLQTKGTLWGNFDPQTTTIVAGVFGATVMCTYGAIAGLRLAWYFAVGAFFVLPNAILLFVVFALIQGRPRGYLRDWLATFVFGRVAVDHRAITEPERPILDEL